MKVKAPLLAALIVLALFTGGCGGTGDQSFSADDYPFSFDYPSGWTLTHGANFNYEGSNAAQRSVSVALKDPFDQVTVTEYKLKKKLPKGANAYRPEVDRIVARMAREAGGKASDAKAVKYGGLPGYQYVIAFDAAGAKLQSKLTLLFQGSSEYEISCQSTADKRTDLNEGCEQILGSFELT